MIVSLPAGDIVEWVQLEWHITEMFDVTAMPGVICPMTVGPATREIQKTVTFDPLA